MKPIHYIALGLIAFGVWTVVKDRNPNPPGPSPSPIPDVVFPVPSPDLQGKVAGVKTYRGKKNANVVAKFYLDFADVMGRDSTVVKTVGQFRAGHVRAQTLMAQQTDMAGSLPGLSAQIDSVLVSVIGVDDVPIDRPKVVSVLNAIAWALGGNG